MSNMPCMQYYYEEYCRKDTWAWVRVVTISELKGFIRRVVNQLRLRVEQIKMEGMKTPDERQLVALLNRDYYYQKLLPLVMGDAVKDVCLKQQRKVLRKGMMTDVREVSVEGEDDGQCEVDVLLKEAESSKCIDIGLWMVRGVMCRSEYAKQLGFHLY